MSGRRGPGRRAASARSARDIELRTIEEEASFRRDLERVMFCMVLLLYLYGHISKLKNELFIYLESIE